MCKKRRNYFFRVLLTVLAVLAGTLTAPAVPGGTLTALAAENTAATMRLEKTEGSVEVSDNSGKDISLMEHLRLYNGYRVGTLEESYAWINLDSTKLAKLDAVSEADIRKSGKKLEILLDSGNLFFNVSEPLEDDESLNIRTSTMVLGIRGTCGWVELLDERSVRVSVLEGTVEIRVTDPVTGEIRTDRISGGEMVVCKVYGQDREEGRCEILRGDCTKEDVRGFVLAELLPDASLRETIFRESGIDLRDLTGEDAEGRLEADEGETRQSLAEIADAQKRQKDSTSAALVWEGSDGGAMPEILPQWTYLQA